MAIGAGASGQKGGIAQGGGILALEPLTLTDSTVSANLADASAGAGGTVSSGADGGGLEAQVASGKSSLISNSTIAGNVAKADLASGPGPATGGGLDTFIATGGTLTIQSSTIAGNAAPSGGNIDPNGAGAQRLASTIVAGGTGLAGQENCSAPLTSLGHNIESLNQCGLSGTGDRMNTDPRLGPLQDNGGPGPTLGFGMDSPAFNAADAATCPAADERGVARPQGAGCDVGAFELELADLGLRASASDEHVDPGQTVTFALNGFNGGSGFGHATTIVDQLPAGLAFVSAKPSSGTCVGMRTISCTIGEVGPGAPGGVQVVARATKPGAQVSSTSIASSTVDPAGANNAASVTVTVNKLRMAAAGLSRRRFRLGSLLPKLSKVRKGTTIRFTLPEAAQVKLSFARERGKRFRAAGSFTVRGHAGQNKLRFQGRLSHRKTLKPGRYRLTLRATDRFGNRSQSKKLNFTLLP